jgi:succinyl-CoA synthetase beta subunit
MNLHEYQAKQLFARYGLPAPVGYACTTRVKQKKPHLKSAPARG